VVGESRAGAYVGGDFFDVIQLSETRLAVALGDVTEHGVAASVLMTAAQGFLHAALEQHDDVARAVCALNRFVHPRRSDERFVTLWVGVLDLQTRTLRYVDGGHGYAMMIRPDGAFERLDKGDGLPIGLFDGIDYASVEVALPAGGRMLVVSDGIIEQYGPVTQADGQTTTAHFEMARVQQTLSSLAPGADPVAAIFDAVTKHAGSPRFQDDATAVLVTW
jgi:serine phosphatase RsbU (regulator of sigma subunit)